MSKYTYEDVIIDPTSEEAKNCIGKMVYFASNPSDCLHYANNNSDYFCKILQSIEVDKSLPFVIRADNNLFYTRCLTSSIILKEEPKPECAPFESADEFLDAYEDSTYRLACKHGGMWLKSKCNSVLTKCMRISDKGIVLEINPGITYWDNLINDYEFMDGTPCGKLKEEPNG